MNNNISGFPPIGENLKQERLQHHLSLSELAKASGISKAMLSQIEAEKVNPTLVTMWKIARALSVDVSELIREGKKTDYFYRMKEDQQAELSSEDGNTLFKILTAPDLPNGLEMYHVLIQPGAVHLSEPHAPGCKEFIFVMKGSVKITNGEHSALLNQGDFLAYDGALQHSIENPTKKIAELHMIDFA